jgi:replication initiation and membrane attachment protein DnaB
MLLLSILLALWLANTEYQSISVKSLSWIYHWYFTQMVRILYSNVDQSSEFSIEKLSRRIQRPETRRDSLAMDQSRILKL